MIKNIIFDFGDVFINLDKSATAKALNQLGIHSFTKEMIGWNEAYEKGELSTDNFIKNYQTVFPNISKTDLLKAWNSILLDFPKQRLHFLQELQQQDQYRLFLLSNTNALHIQWIIDHIDFYDDFQKCFEQFYLSHEIHMRKPNTNIFEFVLNKNQLIAAETLFIDDTKENTDAAATLGIQVWNNNPQTEDISNLFTIKKHLF